MVYTWCIHVLDVGMWFVLHQCAIASVLFSCKYFKITYLPDRFTIISVPLRQNSSHKFFPSRVISMELFVFAYFVLFFGGSLILLAPTSTPLIPPSSTEGPMAQLLLLLVFCAAET